MDWTWAIGIPLLLMVLLCPLMMIAMMFGGWIFGRRALGGGQGGHGGHGMMCMGHGSHGDQSSQSEHEHEYKVDRALVLEELRAERERLDRLITSEERDGH